MAETAEQQQEEQHQEPREEPAVVDPDEAEKKRPQPPLSQGLPAMTFTIWPPSQRTRDAVINRLVETLARESILSKRYGAIPGDEAAGVARQIEEEAFSAAAASAPAPADAAADDLEIGTLQIYSREISKRMLSTVKARASSASSSPPSTPPIETPPPASAAAAAAPASSDEAPSGESETSQA